MKPNRFSRIILTLSVIRPESMSSSSTSYPCSFPGCIMMLFVVFTTLMFPIFIPSFVQFRGCPSFFQFIFVCSHCLTLNLIAWSSRHIVSGG